MVCPALQRSFWVGETAPWLGESDMMPTVGDHR
jgi:hypothetical protein